MEEVEVVVVVVVETSSSSTSSSRSSRSSRSSSSSSSSSSSRSCRSSSISSSCSSRSSSSRCCCSLQLISNGYSGTEGGGKAALRMRVRVSVGWCRANGSSPCPHPGPLTVLLSTAILQLLSLNHTNKSCMDQPTNFASNLVPVTFPYPHSSSLTGGIIVLVMPEGY